MTYLAPSLQQIGYIGATGSTPYSASSGSQVATLQNQYNTALTGQNLTRSPNGAVQISLNFDGTQNNREYPDTTNGEVQTNVANLAELAGFNPNNPNSNVLYYSGIGAQTERTGALLPNGNPDPRSRPSDLQSLPGKAGELGNEIIDRAYRELSERVAAILRDNPNAQISLNLTGFSRGSAEAVAFANLVNERGIPGLYPAGQVLINSMVLYGPVSQTDGELNVGWPTNLVNPALVFIATAENRSAFAAMPAH